MKHTHDKRIRECATCEAGAVLVTEKQGANGDQRYWQGFIKCNRPECGMRTRRCKNPDNAMRIWNADPEDYQEEKTNGK